MLHLLYSGQGGLGSYFMNFVKSDRAGRFDHFVFFYGVEPLFEEYKKFCEERNITYVYLRKEKKISLEYLRPLKQFIQDHKIDTVVYHTFSQVPSLFFLRGVKIVGIDHTAARIKTKREWLYAWILHTFSTLFIYFYKEQFESLRKKFPFIRWRASHFILPKSVDTNEFKRDSAKRTYPGTAPFTIGMAGRLIRGKRVDVILKALKLLSLKNIQVHCRFAGGGPDLIASQELTSSLGLEKNIEFMGVLRQEQMVEFYNSLDAYVHATDGETICYSIMEAQACELPVIASDVSGVNTVLQHEQTALLFDNEPGKLSAMINEIIVNRELREKLSVRSRETARANDQGNAEKLYARLLELEDGNESTSS